MWWSQSSFHLIITHMTCLWASFLLLYLHWPVNGPYYMHFTLKILQLFVVRARCRLLTKTADRTSFCSAPPLQLQQKGEKSKKVWKWKIVTIFRIFRRKQRLCNDFGWYYLCGFIVGFHSFWKNYATNTEYSSSKMDLFTVWIR